MNFSAIFINRPVATTLLTLAIALAGILAFFQLVRWVERSETHHQTAEEAAW
jgi:hypothetical protein